MLHDHDNRLKRAKATLKRVMLEHPDLGDVECALEMIDGTDSTVGTTVRQDGTLVLSIPVAVCDLPVKDRCRLFLEAIRRELGVKSQVYVRYKHKIPTKSVGEHSARSNALPRMYCAELRGPTPDEEEIISEAYALIERRFPKFPRVRNKLRIRIKAPQDTDLYPVTLVNVGGYDVILDEVVLSEDVPVFARAYILFISLLSLRLYNANTRTFNDEHLDRWIKSWRTSKRAVEWLHEHGWRLGYGNRSPDDWVDGRYRPGDNGDGEVGTEE